MDLNILLAEPEEKGTTQISIGKATHMRLRRISKTTGLSMAEIVARYGIGIEKSLILARLDKAQRSKYFRGELSRADFRKIVGENPAEATVAEPVAAESESTS